MGVVTHHFISPYSLIMGVLWFNAFVLLGLLMRKLKFPIRFSIVPLLLLLVLSVLRMFIAVEIPGAIIILSETIYPTMVSFLRYEILPNYVLGLTITMANALVFIWLTGTVWLTARYVYVYVGRFHPIMNWLESHERDKHAESLLTHIIGADKHFRIYRNGSINTAIATAFRPYIILPEVDFSPDELRVILLHEWKHIRDKDYLTGIIVNVITFAFWWNPAIYILRRNFRFAQELKCDQFAVSNKKEFHHFLDGILILDGLKKEKMYKRMDYESANAFISGDDGLADRIEVLALRGESRKKRILTNACYSVVIIALFLVSYMFVILPIFWESPYISIVTSDFRGEHNEESEEAFRSEETFLVNNGGGTFSVYIDGQFVMHIDNHHELFVWFPIRARECN